MSERKSSGEESSEKKGTARRYFSVDSIERTSFTISLALVMIGLICLPYVEKGGSTWYVLILVFGLNALLIIWILCRILLRRRRK